MSFEEHILSVHHLVSETHVAGFILAKWPSIKRCPRIVRGSDILILATVLKLKMPFKKPDFTIDDAFSESAEDKIRLYTRTSESVPLTEETIQVHSNLSISAEELNLIKLKRVPPWSCSQHVINIRKSRLGFLTLEVLRVIQRPYL